MNLTFLSALTLALGLLGAGSAAGYRQLMKAGSPVGNECPRSTPWPCKSGQCLSFAFICDGREDCSDGYDEDKALCTAKDRPASVILKMFIQRFHKWLIPGVLGEGTPDELSKLLTEERNANDYAKKVRMTPEQRQTLLRTMEFARDGRVLDLIMEGMPEEAYREAYALFGRIVESGFLGSEVK